MAIFLEKEKDTEERKTIDILYLISETRQCLHCRTKTKAGFPEGVDGPEQYGVETELKRQSLIFLMVQMMSLAKSTRSISKGLIGRMYLFKQ